MIDETILTVIIVSIGTLISCICSVIGHIRRFNSCCCSSDCMTENDSNNNLISETSPLSQIKIVEPTNSQQDIISQNSKTKSPRQGRKKAKSINIQNIN